MNNNRRAFLQQSSALAGGLLLSSLGTCALASGRRLSPSDQINVGAIGVNGMGWADLPAALKPPGGNMVALCDVDKNVLDKRLKDLSGMNDASGKKIDTSRIKTYGDYRKI